MMPVGPRRQRSPANRATLEALWWLYIAAWGATVAADYVH
jgi:hypothetical protein